MDERLVLQQSDRKVASLKYKERVPSPSVLPHQVNNDAKICHENVRKSKKKNTSAKRRPTTLAGSMEDEEFVNVCQEPLNEIKLVAKDLQGSKIVRFPAFARAN